MKNNAELISALNVISKQRGISVDILADAIESALVSAYKKNYNVNRLKTPLRKFQLKKQSR